MGIYRGEVYEGIWRALGLPPIRSSSFLAKMRLGIRSSGTGLAPQATLATAGCFSLKYACVAPNNIHRRVNAQQLRLSLI